MSLDKQLLRQVIEGALLAAGQPLSRDKLLSLFAEDESGPEKEDIQAALEEIQADCEGRGFELQEVGSGWRFQVRSHTAPWVNRLWDEKPQKYSRALLETLALIAYRQPITRGDIEEIRGVAVSSHIIKTLSERDWIKVVGHRDVPGRPSLYATTRQFLDYFNLKSLEELPSLGELQDLDSLNNELDWGDASANPPAAVESTESAAEQTSDETRVVADEAGKEDEADKAEAPVAAAEPELDPDDILHPTPIEEGQAEESAFQEDGLTEEQLAQLPAGENIEEEADEELEQEPPKTAGSLFEPTEAMSVFDETD